MIRPLAVGFLALVACRTTEDDLSQRVTLNEADLAAINTRLDTLEAELQALVGSGEAGGITDTLSTLQEQVDTLAVTVSENEQDLYIHTEEIHQLSDEIAALRTDVNINEADIASQATEIATNSASSTANTSAISAIQADYLTSTDQANLQANIDTNTTTTTALTNAVNGNASAITANTSAITANTTALGAISSDYLTSASESGLQAGIDANTSDIAANAGAVAAISSDYLTSASESGLQAGIDANTAAVSSIQSSYLPWIDDVSTYLDADTTSGIVTVVAADLEVENHVYGNTFSRNLCGGNVYSCSPTECQAHCQAEGGRMAFVEEALAWASAGNNQCSWMWMLEDSPDSSQKAYPVAAYPMFTNRTSPGCGALNTGDIPRLAGYNTFNGDESNWSEASNYDCACSSLN